MPATSHQPHAIADPLPADEAEPGRHRRFDREPRLKRWARVKRIRERAGRCDGHRVRVRLLRAAERPEQRPQDQERRDEQGDRPQAGGRRPELAELGSGRPDQTDGDP